jgi:hypothetical protein
MVHRRAGKTMAAVMLLIVEALRATTERPRYAYVAPLLKQAKDVCWDALRFWAQKIPGTRINEAELWAEFPNGARIRLYGADSPDALRGIGLDGLVLDEVAQMERRTWAEVLLPALSDRSGWVLVIGTPHGVNLFSELYYAALSDSNWYAAVYTVHDTDNAIPLEEQAILKATMTDRQWRQEMLCDILASSDDTLISLEDVRAATMRHVRHEEYAYAPKILGVDVAWMGGDRSVIFPRQGLVAFEPIVIAGIDEKSFARRVANAINKWGADHTFIDTTGGYGGEVLSRVQEAGYNAQGVVFSWKASMARFQNLRAEMWWRMSEWIKQGGSLPEVQGLAQELCAPAYSYDNASNRFALESKADIRARIGLSPDCADALAVTWAFPVAQTALVDPRMGVHEKKMVSDFDPMRDA